MKLLWLCNMVPGAVKGAITGKQGNGLWVDHVLMDLRERTDITIRILCPQSGNLSGVLDERCSYCTFARKAPYQYLPENEAQFRRELKAFSPDVIHIWGTEYAHTLAMVNAAEKEGFLDRVVVSIQGLCCYIAGHYCDGVPNGVQHGFTPRDFLRQDNPAQQQHKFSLRGELEKKALSKVHYVMGRTHWDKACTQAIAPQAQYLECRETLRETFYRDLWQYDSCRKHRIMASACYYPVKGFHYLLEAFAQVVKTYPDATIAVPGSSYLKGSLLHRDNYQKYLRNLTRKYGLQDKIEFLGSLDAEGMKQAYLDSHVFVLPSTMENSPNSLGEAMILGLPCVAADVGGVTTMMTHNTEGFVYPSTAPHLLAHYIKTLFAMEENAADMGLAARQHALVTHDPEENLRCLLEIYHKIGN